MTPRCVTPVTWLLLSPCVDQNAPRAWRQGEGPGNQACREFLCRLLGLSSVGLRRGTRGGGNDPGQHPKLNRDGTQRFFAQSMVPREQTAASFLRAEASELLFEMLDEREQQGIG